MTIRFLSLSALALALALPLAAQTLPTEQDVQQALPQTPAVPTVPAVPQAPAIQQRYVPPNLLGQPSRSLNTAIVPKLPSAPPAAATTVPNTSTPLPPSTPAPVQAEGVPNAPPPMPHEYVPRPPQAPAGTMVWVPGYWGWNGENYVWIKGSYVPRPTNAKAWVPGKWYNRFGEWFWQSGYWQGYGS